MNDKLFVISEKDNVGIHRESGHKYALTDIPMGATVYKYGHSIGRATADIQKGEWVHTHNLQTALAEETEYTYTFHAATPEKSALGFSGYKRKDRRAGIRNDIYIIPTVGCVNGICQKLSSMAQALVGDGLDGIYALTHPFGCSQLGNDHENLKHLLASIAENPNAAFVLFVGLGCENNQIAGIQALLSHRDHISYLVCQEVEDEIAVGYDLLEALASKARQMKREPCDITELCLGLKCGGSDGFSGLTANPLVGKLCDRIIGAGGSAVLTEVPEMFGAEQILMNKCASPEIFARYREMILNFKQYYTDAGFPVYENPSPGNKAGGITTLEEKSLGCVEKAGGSAIVDVLSYGEQAKETGLSVLDAPGNDLIAATALGAAGCQLVLFTTGRGTPFSTFVPTMKIASNHALVEKKSHWIDFDASGMDEEAFLSLVLKTASGTYRCKSEDMREIAFFKNGITL